MMMQRRPSTSIVSKILYGLFLLSALLACHFRWKTMDALELVQTYTRTALQLHTMAVIENMEVFFLDQQADRLEHEAQKELSQARRFHYDSQVEQVVAEREEQRAAYFEHLAQQDQAQADQAWRKVQHDEARYEQLIRNMTATEQALEDTQRPPIQKGLCGSSLLYAICEAVEGTVDLQRRADAESVLLQQELLRAQQTKKQELLEKEFMDELIAQALQQQATRYNETSHYLYDMADHFQNQSRAFAKKASAYNETAEELVEVTDAVEEQEQMEFEWEKGNMSLAEKKLLRGQEYYKLATRYATAASVLAIPAFMFFLARAFIHAWYMGLAVAGCSSTSNPSKAGDFWRCFSYGLMHVTIFLLCVGFVGKFVIKMNYYDWGQRAAIVAWFAILAAFIQTTCLHVVPLISSDRLVAHAVVRHGLVRLTMLFCLFGIEFLLAWVTFGPWLQIASGPLGFWVYRLVAMVLLAAHLYMYPERASGGSSMFQDEDESLDVTSSLGDESLDFSVSGKASEFTPLTGASTSKSSSSDSSRASSGATAIAFELMDLGPLARGKCGNSSVQTRSPRLENFHSELHKLRLPFEVLLVACSVKVIIDCFPISWQSTVIICSLWYLLMAVVCLWQILNALAGGVALADMPRDIQGKLLQSFIELQSV
jgi:chemotaxis protein histidine kinase CheA